MSSNTAKTTLAFVALVLGASQAVAFPANTAASKAAPGTIANAQWHATPWINPRCLKPSWPRGCRSLRLPRSRALDPDPYDASGCVYPYRGACDPAYFYPAPYFTGWGWNWYGY